MVPFQVRAARVGSSVEVSQVGRFLRSGGFTFFSHHEGGQPYGVVLVQGFGVAGRSLLRPTSLFFVFLGLVDGFFSFFFKAFHGVGFVSRVGWSYCLVSYVREDASSNLVVQGGACIDPRYCLQVWGTVPSLSHHAIGYVYVIAYPVLQRVVRRSQVGSHAAAKASFGRGVQVFFYGTFRGVVWSGRVPVASLLFLLCSRAYEVRVYRESIRVPLCMVSFSVSRVGVWYFGWVFASVFS